MRIVSLAPAATEIACTLGLTESVVGISHECDYPPEVIRKPVVTAPRIDADGSSAEIDRAVVEALAAGTSATEIRAERVLGLEPDVVLAQAQCGVCAATASDLRRIWEQRGLLPPRIVELRASCIEEIFADIERVAAALGVAERGSALVAEGRRRLEEIRGRAARGRSRPRVLVLEWLDPPIVAGHWVPELVALAGGTPVAAEAGGSAARTSWDAVAEVAPDVLILAPCGLPLERIHAEFPAISARPQWRELPAVRNGRVYAVDGRAWLSRPGPRIVEAAGVLAGIIQPGYCAVLLPERGWSRLPPP